MKFITILFLYLSFFASIAQPSVLQKKVESLPIKQPWADFSCDTTRLTDSLEIIDMVMPYRFYEKKKSELQTQPRVFYVEISKTGKITWACVTSNEKFQPFQFIDSALQLDGWGIKNLNQLEKQYLWSLADNPVYLYDRWSFFLQEGRIAFLKKRQELMDNFSQKNPEYTFRITSDMRTASNQLDYFKNLRSLTPISQHQFGFASDFALFKSGKYLREYAPYQKMAEIGKQLSMVWGGDFKGFVDPSHFQLYDNTAVFLLNYPELRFEFEPYRAYYTDRVTKMIATGREDQVEESKALLIAMNQLRRSKSCTCENAPIRTFKPSTLGDIQQKLKKVGYIAYNDILLIANANTAQITMQYANNPPVGFKLGKWL